MPEKITEFQQKRYEHMNDDFNTPVLIAHLFDAIRIIKSTNDNKATLTQADINSLKNMYQHFVFDVMRLKKEEETGKANQALAGVMELIIDLRNKAKANKDYATSDAIRNKLTEVNIQIKDTKEGTNWSI